MASRNQQYIRCGAIGLLALAASFAAVDATALPLDEIVFPHLHAIVAMGDASEDPESLAAGGHDPSRDLTVQGLELGASLRLHEKLEGFTTWRLSYGAEESWEDEWEEGFLKLQDLPGGFEFRAGRLLNRIGERNARHLHAWETVDQHVVLSRFLGEDGLITDGAELGIHLPTSFESFFSLSYGDAPSHDHGEEEETGADGFSEELLTANVIVKAHRDDFNQFTFSAAYAEDGGEQHLYGGGGNYTWRENGLEAGGRQLSWSTEVYFREWGATLSENGAPVLKADALGAFSSVVWSLHADHDLGLRLDFVESVRTRNLSERTRWSPHWTFYPNEQRALGIRLQYNFDEFSDQSDAHSIWLQLRWSFGGEEVR